MATTTDNPAKDHTVHISYQDMTPVQNALEAATAVAEMREHAAHHADPELFGRRLDHLVWTLEAIGIKVK